MNPTSRTSGHAFTLLSTFLLPVLASAQTTGVSVTTIGASILTGIDSLFIPLIFTLALGSFTYGTLQYFVQGLHDDDIKQKSVALMVYGVVILFADVIIWAAIHILAGSLGF